MSQPASVLDASALLAWLRNEPGALSVEAALDTGSAMSVINWAEVLSKSSDLGRDPEDVRRVLLQRGILPNSLLLWPVDEDQAFEIAQLRSKTRSSGLSLGDRACLALAHRLHIPVLTTDRDWKTLKVGVQIQLIR